VLEERRAQRVAQAVDGGIVEGDDGYAFAHGVSSGFAHPGDLRRLT
jgi:hypothetical protein